MNSIRGMECKRNYVGMIGDFINDNLISQNCKIKVGTFTQSPSNIKYEEPLKLPRNDVFLPVKFLTSCREKSNSKKTTYVQYKKIN